MRDRQYLASLASFVVGVLAALAGIVALPLWLGWPGAVPSAVIGGGCLVYFYWGPRSDSRLRRRGDGTDWQRHA